MASDTKPQGILKDGGGWVDIDLRQQVRAYLEGRLTAPALYNWTFERVEVLLTEPNARSLAGAVLGGAWFLREGSPDTALKADLRKEMGLPASPAR